MLEIPEILLALAPAFALGGQVIQQGPIDRAAQNFVQSLLQQRQLQQEERRQELMERRLEAQEKANELELERAQARQNTFLQMAGQGAGAQPQAQPVQVGGQTALPPGQVVAQGPANQIGPAGGPQAQGAPAIQAGGVQAQVPQQGDSQQGPPQGAVSAGAARKIAAAGSAPQGSALRQEAEAQARRALQDPDADPALARQAGDLLGLTPQQTEQIRQQATIDARIQRATRDLPEKDATLLAQMMRARANGASAGVIEASFGERVDDLRTTTEEKLRNDTERLRQENLRVRIRSARRAIQQEENRQEAFRGYLRDNTDLSDEQVEQMVAGVGPDGAQDILANVANTEANPAKAKADLTLDFLSMTGAGGERLFNIRQARAMSEAVTGTPLDEIETINADVATAAEAVRGQDVDDLRDRLDERGVENVDDLSNHAVRRQVVIMELRSKYGFIDAASFRPLVNRTLSSDEGAVSPSDSTREKIQEDIDEGDPEITSGVFGGRGGGRRPAGPNPLVEWIDAQLQQSREASQRREQAFEEAGGD